MVLEFSDGARVELELGALTREGFVPQRRQRGRWRELRDESRLLSGSAAPEDNDDRAHELCTGEVEAGARVAIRGVITDVRALEGESGSAFRGSVRATIVSVRVTHLGFGPSPARALQAAVNGVGTGIPSILDDRSRALRIYLSVSLALIAIAPFVARRLVLLANVSGWVAVLLSCAGIMLAGSAAFFDHQLSLDRSDGGSPVDMRRPEASVGTLLFSLLSLSTVGMISFMDLLHGLSPGPGSFARMVLGASVVSVALATALASVRTLRFHGFVARVVGASAATARSGGRVRGRVTDDTPVESSVGPAGVVAITEEEIVPGSDPNIASHRTHAVDGFALKTDTGEIAIDPHSVRWASTVYLRDRIGTRNGNSLDLHAAIVPVGAPAIGWGRLYDRAGERPALGEFEAKPAMLFVCAPHEDPETVLRSLRQRAMTGVALCVIALCVAVGTLVALWSRVPAVPSDD
jgi:hypothetical protein